MTSLWDNSVSTSLGDNVPRGATDPRSTIQVTLLRNAPLKNEEIIELTAFLCNAESIDLYIDHVVALRDRYDMSVEVRPLEIEILSLRDKFPLRALRNFYIAVGDVGYHGMVPQVITMYQQDVAASVYILNLEAAFGVQPDDEFVRSTIQFIDDSDMSGPGLAAIRRLYQNKLDRISRYAPIPKYIRDFDIKVNELPHLEEKEVTGDMPPELIAEYLVGQMDSYDLYVEETDDITAKDVFVEKIEGMNEAEKTSFVTLFKVDQEEIKRIQTNRDVFRVYGPANAYLDTDFSNLRNEDTNELDVNLIFGGARMFTDMSIEYDYENELPVDDWFRGYCLQCSLRIRAYHHAVREPVLQGGWKGCYCSWACVREFIRLDTEHDADLYNMYVVQKALINEIETAMIEIGIQDRDYEEPDEEAEAQEGTGLDAQAVSQDAVEDLIAKIPKLEITDISIPIVPTPYDEYPF